MTLHLHHLLVAGGAGFIGSAFVRQQLSQAEHVSITILDQLPADDSLDGVRDDPRLRVVHGDVGDEPLVDLLARDADGIVNFASAPKGDPATNDPRNPVQTHLVGTTILLQAAQRHGHKRFLQVSTAEVPAAAGHGPSRAPDQLRSPYAMSKAAAEMLVASYWASHRLPVLITRGVSTFGPGQPPGTPVHEFITRALAGVALPGRRTDSTPHDYLYVEDHASAIAQVLWNGVPGETYDVGAGLAVTEVELADAVLQLCGGRPSEKRFVMRGPARERQVVLDCRLLRLLGWTPRHDLESALRLTIAWYRSQEARLRRPPALAGAR